MKTVKTIPLNFSPSGKGGMMCPDGEVHCVQICNDGEWREIPDKWESGQTTLFKCPDGMHPLCVHVINEKDTRHHHIAVSDTGGIFWNDTSKPSKWKMIAGSATISPHQGCAIGRMVAFLTEKGMHYVIWQPSSEDYAYPGSLPESPAIEFALSRECVTGFSPRASDWPSRYLECGIEAGDEQRVNNWFSNDTLHNPGIPSGTTLSNITETTMRFIRDFQRECTCSNLFTSPFLVMHALRLNNGSRIMPSAPVLMIPNSASPTLHVTEGSASDSVFRFRLSAMVRACRLHFRMLHTRQLKRWEGFVTHVDIFISPQTPLFTDEATVTGIHTVLPDGFSHSGTITALSTGVTDNDNYHRHDPDDYPEDTVIDNGGENPASSGEKVRAFIISGKSKNEIETEIARCHEMRLVASLPIGKLPTSRAFIPVDMADNSLCLYESLERYTPDHATSDIFIPEHIAEVNSRLALIAPLTAIKKPRSLRELTPYTPVAAGAQTWRIRLSAFTMKNGESFSAEGDGYDLPYEDLDIDPDCIPDPATSFPRYIFHPDPDAIRLILEASANGKTRRWSLPLQRHPFWRGAYYFRGLDDAMPREITEMPPATPGWWAQRELLAMSVSANPLHFPSTLRCSPGYGRILGISSTTRNLSAGQLGEFPFYLFTDKGIWALALNGESLKAVQPVSLHRCSNPDSITPTPSGTMFATPTGLKIIEGTTVKDACMSETESIPALLHRQITLRPLKLGDFSGRKRISSVEIIGINLSDTKIRLWGAMRPGKWIPLAEGENPLQGLAGSGWRYHLLSVMTLSQTPEEVEGVKITLR